MKNIVMGDIHGEFGMLNTFINKHQPKVILQAGDNAYYWSKSNVGVIKPQNTKVYFVPGNHENWDMFEEAVGRRGTTPVEVEKNIFMCPIGSTIEINGQTILFVGGADSIDKDRRLPKLSWWEQEILNYDDFEYISANVKKADIVISHTAPTHFVVGRDNGWSRAGLGDKDRDPSRPVLNLVLTQYRPKLWYFGHWHEYSHGYFPDTETNWTCLDMIIGGRYFMELEKMITGSKYLEKKVEEANG